MIGAAIKRLIDTIAGQLSVSFTSITDVDLGSVHWMMVASLQPDTHCCVVTTMACQLFSSLTDMQRISHTEATLAEALPGI